MIESTATASFSLRRTFDAPSELVFRVFTEPEFVAEWWGCEGSTTIVRELDVRTGGTYHIEVHLADGTVYASRGIYSEFVPNRRIVSKDDAATHTLTFEERDGKTTVNLVVAFATEAALARAVDAGVREGTSRSWDTIERILDVNR